MNNTNGQNDDQEPRESNHLEKLQMLKLSTPELTREEKIEKEAVSKTLLELKTGLLLKKSYSEKAISDTPTEILDLENKSLEKNTDRVLNLSDLKNSVNELKLLDLVPNQEVVNSQKERKEAIKSIETTLFSASSEIKIKEKQLTIKDFEDIIKTSSGIVRVSGGASSKKNSTKPKNPRKIIRAGAKKIKKTSGNKRVYKDVYEFEKALLQYLKDTNLN
jgi:hypothetical protein